MITHRRASLFTATKVVLLFPDPECLGDDVYDLQIAASHTEILGGEDVTIQCRVEGWELGESLHWWKRQGEEEVQIGSNREIQEPFTERYSVEVAQNGEVVTFYLNIRGMEGENE